MGTQGPHFHYDFGDPHKIRDPLMCTCAAHTARYDSTVLSKVHRFTFSAYKRVGLLMFQMMNS